MHSNSLALLRMQWAALGRGSFFPLVLVMAFAILRIEKIKSAANAAAKTGHNYRLHPVANADESQQGLNQELVNHTQRPLWELAEARVAELGLKRLRTDAVKAVEVLLTASPEAFPRDAQSQAVDMRGSAWLAANQRFLTERFGVANVVALTLHQDEQTPHLHAVIVPATADGRLSARDVFNPASLRQLQTDYSLAMQAAGFAVQRGIEGSTAKHESLRAYYGARQASAEQLVSLSPEQVVAVAATSLHAQQRQVVQQQQLAAAQALKQQHYEQLQAEQAQRRTKEQLLTRWAVRYAQDEDMSKFQLGGQEEREKALRQVEAHLALLLARPGVTMQDVVTHLQTAGYPLVQGAGKALQLAHQASGARFELTEVQPNGHSLFDYLRVLNRAQELEKKERTAQEQAKPKGPRPKF
jgi:hypothetical protein